MTEVCARCLRQPGEYSGESNGELHSGLCHNCLIEYQMYFERELFMEKREVERQISIMTDPTQWEGRRVFPLVRDRGGEREVGFLYLNVNADVRLMPTVYLGTMLQVVERRGDKIFVEELTHEEVMALTSLTYPTFSSIVYDGWKIDG